MKPAYLVVKAVTLSIGSQGGTPDIGRKGASGPEDGLWWFSCTFEGEPARYTGHAIGWVSGDLAWLVTSPDKAHQ